MAYEEDLSYCPPETGALLERYGSRCDDEAAERLNSLFQPRGTELPPVLCFRGIVGSLARSIEPHASPDYVTFLLARIWSIRGELGAHPQGTGYLGPDYLADLRNPFEVLTYSPPLLIETPYAFTWFGCARILNVDCREHVADRIVWNWSFGEDYMHDETWNHAKYLASYGDNDALEGLAGALEQLTDGNTVLSALHDLVDTPVVSPGALEIVASYKDDPRPTDDGLEDLDPIPLGAEVQILLDELNDVENGQ